MEEAIIVENGSAMEVKLPDKIWNTAFICLFFVNMAFNMGQNMSNTLMPVYSDYLGASSMAVGMVFSAFAISALAFRFISSPIMDTYSRKYVVILASIIMMIAFLGFSISKSISALIVFRLVQGCGQAFGNACCIAMVSDMIPRDKYGAGIGYFSTAMVIAQAIGPSLGLWLVDIAGYQAAFWANAGCMFLSVFLASRLNYPFKRTKKLTLNINRVIAKEVLVPSVLLLLIITGFHFGNSFIVLCARTRGIQSIGLYFTVSAVTVMITRPLMGKMIDKYGAVKVVLPALCFNVTACFLVSNAMTLWQFLAASAVNALGTCVAQPAFQTLSMKCVASDRRGSASSTNYIGMDLAALIGPFLGGMVAQTYGYSAMYKLQAIPFVLCMVVLFLCRDWVRNTEQSFSKVKT